MKNKLKINDFLNSELVSSGFNPENWLIKEEPLEDEVWIIQNKDDSVEFRVERKPDNALRICYSVRDGYAMQDKLATSVQEAIELGETFKD